MRTTQRKAASVVPGGKSRKQVEGEGVTGWGPFDAGVRGLEPADAGPQLFPPPRNQTSCHRTCRRSVASA